MVRLCKEAIATEQWASETQDECVGCELGAVTAFFATGKITCIVYSDYPPPPPTICIIDKKKYPKLSLCPARI